MPEISGISKRTFVVGGLGCHRLSRLSKKKLLLQALYFFKYREILGKLNLDVFIRKRRR